MQRCVHVAVLELEDFDDLRRGISKVEKGGGSKKEGERGSKSEEGGRGGGREAGRGWGGGSEGV
eukprot:755474-Hanusia_phi.AAC.3